jgi:uncharacterized protein YcbK (DUF882 family)
MSTLRSPLNSFENGVNRRRFLRLMVWAGLISCSSKSVFAAIDKGTLEERSLSLYNPHTKESFNGIYWCDGDCVASAKEDINHILRDIRTDDVKEIDLNLLDLIFAISTKLQAEEPFTVISGYRSPETNELLRKRGRGAAKNSYHIKGQAADIRLPGYKTSALRKAAFELKVGGVGYYPKRGFVHIDVGPVRYWTGKK